MMVVVLMMIIRQDRNGKEARLKVRRERYAAKSAAMTSLEKEAQRKKDRERKAIWRGKYSDLQNKKRRETDAAKGAAETAEEKEARRAAETAEERAAKNKRRREKDAP